jgi:hypothetical protein
MRAIAKTEIGVELVMNAQVPVLTEEGDHCRCGAQYQNGVWCTRMRGLGHEHMVRRPLARGLSSAPRANE